jgi:hypothetical protein
MSDSTCRSGVERARPLVEAGFERPEDRLDVLADARQVRPDKPLDRLGQQPTELAIVRDRQHLLGHAQRDDLRIRDTSPGVPNPPPQRPWNRSSDVGVADRS